MNYTKTNAWHKVVTLWLLLSMTMVLSLSAATVNIMMLGDSITEGGGGVPDMPENNQSDYTSGLIQNADHISYRGQLWTLLTNDGYTFGTHVDFVGNRSGGSNYGTFDMDHQGTSGWRSDQVRGSIDGWLATAPANMVLLHIGTNDPGNGIPIGSDANASDANTTVNNVKQILNSIFAADASAKVFVARIIEARRAHGFITGWTTNALNNEIATMVANHPKEANIKMVNLESEANMTYNPCGTDLGDMQPFQDINGTYYYDFHPNVNGYTKMAAKWHTDMIDSGWLPNVSANNTTPEHLWTLNDNASPFEDSIGGNSATCAGANCPTQVTGQVGNAQDFNGSNQLYVAPDASLDFDANESYSVEFWMNAKDSTNNQVLVGGSGSSGALWIGTNGTKLKYSIIGTSDDGTIDITLDTWIHVAVIKDTAQGQIRVYINGALVNTKNGVAASAVDFANGLGIGNLNSGYLFNGAIDEVSLYRVALTGAEVLEHYTNGGGAAADTTAPVIAEVTAVTTPTNSTTPSYTFSSDEAGTITYGGACSSATTAATVGNNIISFTTLTDGTYSDCTITVTDTANNASTALAVTAFEVDTTVADENDNTDSDGNGIPDAQDKGWYTYDSDVKTVTVTPTTAAQSTLKAVGVDVTPSVIGNEITLKHTESNAYVTANEFGHVKTGFNTDSTLKSGTLFKAGTNSVMKKVNGQVIIETTTKLNKDESIIIGGN